MQTLEEFVEATGTCEPEFLRASRKGNSVWKTESARYYDGNSEHGGYAYFSEHIVIVDPSGNVINVTSHYDEYSY